MPIENVTSAVHTWTRRQKLCGVYADYMAGRHELRFATRSWRDKYGTLVGDQVLSIRENLCPAAVTAFTDGIEVTSWGAGDAVDAAAREGLSRLEAMVNREAWSKGDAFVLVWPSADGLPTPSFQPAHSIVPHVDAVDPGVLDWAAKVWIDRDRRVGRVNVYTAQGVERWQTTTPIEPGLRQGLPEEASAWTACTDEDGDWIAHTFGAVPVCWFKREAPSAEEWGVSVLADVIPLQDGLNKSLADLIVVSGDYSNPFWYLLNVSANPSPTNPLLAAAAPPVAAYPVALDVPVDEGTPTWEQARKKFDPSRQKIFTHDGPGPFGQLDPPDMTRLQKVQDGFAMKVGRVIGVPSYYLSQTSGDVPSGESLRVLSSRRTGRIKAWQRDAGPVWRGVKQLLGMGDEPVQWADPMPMDATERMQTALDMQTLGYALEDIVRYLGEADADGIVARARQASSQAAQGMARAFLDGTAPATY